MAWNPSPKVSDCRTIARKWKRDRVIILALDDRTMEMASYGETKRLCDDAKKLGDVAYDAIMRYLEDM